ncbi:MAG: hypothetical protein ABW252_09175 [Polyangiales bacterium]
MRRILSVLLTGAVALGACAPEREGDDGEPSEQVLAQQWPFAPSPSARAFGCKGERVALETANGRNYLTAVVGGGFAMMANATSVGPWETFRAYDLGSGRVALQVSNGSYMIAANGGGLLLNANGWGINNESTFRLSWTSGGNWLNLRSASGHYVTAEGGGGNVANVAWLWPSANQGFKAVCVQGDLSDPDSTGDDGNRGNDDDPGGWDDAPQGPTRGGSDDGDDPSWDDVSSADPPGLG